MTGRDADHHHATNGRRFITLPLLLALAAAHGAGWAACWQVHEIMGRGSDAPDSRPTIGPENASSFWDLQTTAFRRFDADHAAILNRLSRVEALIEGMRGR